MCHGLCLSFCLEIRHSLIQLTDCVLHVRHTSGCLEGSDPRMVLYLLTSIKGLLPVRLMGMGNWRIFFGKCQTVGYLD